MSKQHLFTTILLVSGLVISQSCGDDSGMTEPDYKPADYSVKGKVEKGPFISGSTINLQPMDALLQPMEALSLQQ